MREIGNVRERKRGREFGSVSVGKRGTWGERKRGRGDLYENHIMSTSTLKTTKT